MIWLVVILLLYLVVVVVCGCVVCDFLLFLGLGVIAVGVLFYLGV